MYDLDFMLDGEHSRQRHQEIIREVQQENYARRIANSRRKIVNSNRTILNQIRTAFTAVAQAIVG